MRRGCIKTGRASHAIIGGVVMPADRKAKGTKDKLNKIQKAKKEFNADQEMSCEFVKSPLSSSCRPSCEDE